MFTLLTQFNPPMKKEIKISRFFLLAALIMTGILFYSCSGEKKTEERAVDDDAFYATQPVRSGLYDATYYDITGKNARKGPFDGRIYFCLSPDRSALYVFENGNRTKINYPVDLERPFEKGDSGIYMTLDKKGRPVSVRNDSGVYLLKFQRTGEDFTIKFNPQPRSTAPAMDIFDKIEEQINKNKK